MTALAKPSRTARKIAERRVKLDRKNDEKDAKRDVRRRDKRCRFPRCGCRTFGLQLEARGEVSHDKHKAMGGNPAGDRSTSALMVLLCAHRHQYGVFSRHKGTVRAIPHSKRDGYDGPVTWQIDCNAFPDRWYTAAKTWRTVAIERAPGLLEPLTDWQTETLDELARMEL